MILIHSVNWKPVSVFILKVDQLKYFSNFREITLYSRQATKNFLWSQTKPGHRASIAQSIGCLFMSLFRTFYLIAIEKLLNPGSNGHYTHW